jgi:hypothetical protein
MLTPLLETTSGARRSRRIMQIGPADRLKAGLCRMDLLIEIEGVSL